MGVLVCACVRVCNSMKIPLFNLLAFMFVCRKVKEGEGGGERGCVCVGVHVLGFVHVFK